jgi:hypothetical protein
MMTISGLPGKTGFEILEYIGSSSSDMSWWGPVTKTRYVFGGTRRVGYVDARDAAGLLQMGDNGRPNFRVYVKPEVAPQGTIPATNGHAVEIIVESAVVPAKTGAVAAEIAAPAKAKRAVKRK